LLGAPCSDPEKFGVHKLVRFPDVGELCIKGIEAIAEIVFIEKSRTSDFSSEIIVQGDGYTCYFFSSFLHDKIVLR
jgi:hypothetical protein